MPSFFFRSDPRQGACHHLCPSRASPHPLVPALHHPGRKTSALDQAQGMIRAAIAKEAHTTTQQYRYLGDAIAIDEVVLDQRIDQLRTLSQ